MKGLKDSFSLGFLFPDDDNDSSDELNLLLTSSDDDDHEQKGQKNEDFFKSTHRINGNSASAKA